MAMKMLAPMLAINLISYIPWSAIFLLTQLFGVRLYYLKKRDECVRIQKHIQGWCSHITDGGKGYGYSFGYWYAVSIDISPSECGDSYTAYLIATESSYKRLTRAVGEEEVPIPLEKVVPKNKVAVYERIGSYANVWYRRRERDSLDVPKTTQINIVADIIAHHKKNRHTVAYIHGPPSTGKSMIGVLVASEFGSTFCNTLKPWQPGDTIGNLYSEVEPSFSKPVIIVMDEFDAALMRIHEGIAPHPKIPIAVLDKPGWNHMLDEIQRGMYPNIILILTSNRGPEFINALDPSYIRAGRVDMTFEMLEPVAKN